MRTLEEMRQLMQQGLASRTTATTCVNANSSRSHAIFTLTLSQTRTAAAGPSGVQLPRKVSKVSLVDLAGSERVAATGSTGERLREAANINKGLLTLGRVIAALVAKSRPAVTAAASADEEVVVPYRDAMLTWLLKESLGGNAKTAMIATIR